MEYYNLTKEKARELRRAAYRELKEQRRKEKAELKAKLRAEKYAALAELIFLGSELEKIEQLNLANAYFSDVKNSNND